MSPLAGDIYEGWLGMLKRLANFLLPRKYRWLVSSDNFVLSEGEAAELKAYAAEWRKKMEILEVPAHLKFTAMNERFREAELSRAPTAE